MSFEFHSVSEFSISIDSNMEILYIVVLFENYFSILMVYDTLKTTAPLLVWKE